MKRRKFLKNTALAGAGLLLYTRGPSIADYKGMVLKPAQFLGKLSPQKGKTPIKGALWYEAKEIGDGMVYTFEKGALANFGIITADMLLDGRHTTNFILSLQEGEKGPAFGLQFKLLNQCSARIRLQTTWVDQNRWKMDREGAWLNPLCLGDRVDLQNVDRMLLTIHRNGGRPARWCMTDFTATNDTVPKLSKLVLPKGPLLDELGQSMIHDWPEKTRNISEVSSRLDKQLDYADRYQWPQHFSKWGGWTEKQFEKTGFFSKKHDGKRWWLVDPDGYAFWSAGLDCVRLDTGANIEGLIQALKWLPDPDSLYKPIFSDDNKTVNYLVANFIRTFGPDEWHESWADIALSEMRRCGFNTVGNWSEWEIARKASIPYVRPLSFRLANTKKIYRDFPDVFHPDYERDAATYADQLKETVDDPALIGYFLMNEPTWGFSAELPAVGMLFNSPECETRKVLGRFLQEKYQTNEALSQAWGIPTTLDAISAGSWKTKLPNAALKDMEAFSEQMVDRFFKVLTDACKKVDANHMNLGARYHTVPPAWAQKGMRYFDVFSMNCYQEKIPAKQVKAINDLLGLPVMIGEFHFGALDVGLPATGIGHVKDQYARGQAYRIYVEDAAANPWCVGTHYFTQYDQSALGRGDGENYNIGFLDVCNKPYEPLVRAARETHERIYALAAGQLQAYNESVEYYPKLF
jgi:hypothetical protein